MAPSHLELTSLYLLALVVGQVNVLLGDRLAKNGRLRQEIVCAQWQSVAAEESEAEAKKNESHDLKLIKWETSAVGYSD